ncbi:MAG: ADP-ribosyltransferase domain-containing protein [bacterium]|nr:ADP-ribosyltransferase domain-containing protein [bacterium]
MNAITSSGIYTAQPQIQTVQQSQSPAVAPQAETIQEEITADGFTHSSAQEADMKSLMSTIRGASQTESVSATSVPSAITAVGAAETAAAVTADVAASMTPGPAGAALKSLDDVIAHELETAKAFYTKTDKVAKENEEHPLIENPNVSFVTRDTSEMAPIAIDSETAALAPSFGALTVNTEGLSESELQTVLQKTGEHGLGVTIKLMDDQKYLYRTAVEETSMTLAQKTALFAYTGDTYTVMNTALRTHDEQKVALMRPLIDKTVEALATLPSHSGRVYRGGEMPQSFFDEHKPGARVTYSAFTSTSSNPGTAYGGNTQLIIDTADHDSAGKEVSKLSMFPSENEILFPPDTDFIAISHVVKDGKHIINMKELPKHS